MYMTLPNKLTLLRIVLIIPLVIIGFNPYLNEYMIFNDSMSLANLINVIIFAVASITDFLDGYIARKYNLVTTFGKFLDPLADKLLVFTSMVILAYQMTLTNYEYSWILPFWVIIVIISREFVVSGIRLVCSAKGNVIAAGWTGKAKTFVTMVALVIMYFYQTATWVAHLSGLFMYVALVLTVVSGVEYFVKNRKFVLESM